MLLLSSLCLTTVCQIQKDLKSVRIELLHLLSVTWKINQAWNLLTAPLSFDLNYYRCAWCSVVSDFSIRICNLYANGSVVFFPSTLCEMINERGARLSAPICQVRGLPGRQSVNMEYICAVAWFTRGLNSSIRFPMTLSSDCTGTNQHASCSGV